MNGHTVTEWCERRSRLLMNSSMIVDKGSSIQTFAFIFVKELPPFNFTTQAFILQFASELIDLTNPTSK